MSAREWLSIDVASKVMARDVERAHRAGWPIERVALETSATVAEVALEAEDLGLALRSAWPRSAPEKVEQRLNMCRSYMATTSYKETAKVHGVSATLVARAWRDLYGAGITERGGAHHNVRRGVARRAERRRKEIAKMIRSLPATSHLSARAIARHLGLCRNTVAKVIKDEQIATRDPAPYKARIIELLTDKPLLSDQDVAELLGCSAKSVAPLRHLLGLKRGRARREELRSDPEPASTP